MSQFESGEAEAAALLRAAGFDTPPESSAGLLDAAAIAAAVLDGRGRVLAASDAFNAMHDELRLDELAFGRVAAGKPTEFSVSAVLGPGGDEELVVLAYGRPGVGVRWRLPPEVRAAVEDPRAAVVVVTSHGALGEGPLRKACRAFGLTSLETRVALGVIQGGNVRIASERAGIAYETGREALAQAFRRVGVRRLPAFVGRLASQAFGVLPDADPGPALADLWGLTARQATIAALIGQGLSRQDAARTLGLSEAVVGKDLEQVFELLQVQSAAALARKMVEAQAFGSILLDTQGDVGFLDPSVEPLVYVPRPEGGRIAVSDYGPPSGRPVLIVHSSMTSRIVGRGLLRALHAAGYRPISIDRPGFGLSDEHPGARPGEHDPWETAAHDAVLVLDRLKIAATDMVTRGAAQFALALQRLAPHRLGAVVVVNPDPETSGSARRMGPYGVLKEAYRRNPACIRLTGALITKGLTYERTTRMLQGWMAGSDPDQRAIADPELVSDYYHAQRMFGLGKLSGYVNEQIHFARGSRAPEMRGVRHWEVLVAAHDTLHDPNDVLAHWRAVWPDAQFREIEHGGRLMAMSHPHLVVEALDRSRRAKSPPKKSPRTPQSPM